MNMPIKDIERFTECLGVLSNPVRLKIYITILDSACDCEIDEKEDFGGNCVTSISNTLDIPQPSVSNHVKELVHCGLVKTRRIGRKVYLFGTDEIVDDLEKFVGFIRKELEEAKNCAA